MRIPTNFSNTIKEKFYDKEITLYSTADSVDSEGWAKKAGTSVETGSFYGNVSFSNFGDVQESYGIKTKIDITITTDEEIEVGQIIGYLGYQYKVTQVIPSDSHYLLIGEKWSSKSSTYISA